MCCHLHGILPGPVLSDTRPDCRKLCCIYVISHHFPAFQPLSTSCSCSGSVCHVHNTERFIQKRMYLDLPLDLCSSHLLVGFSNSSVPWDFCRPCDAVCIAHRRWTRCQLKASFSRLYSFFNFSKQLKLVSFMLRPTLLPFVTVHFIVRHEVYRALKINLYIHQLDNLTGGFDGLNHRG